ncbi:MAG: hypothetical protein K2H23_06945 [Oscillospiraceae bacterium]|nr:hypothetical protein [Oscillospiraceae bacterium]
MEYYISCAEEGEAKVAVWRKHFVEETKSVLKSFSKIGERNNFNFMTREERQAEFRDEVNAYIEKYLKRERKSLMELFENVRYGKNQEPKEKVFLL